MNAKVTVGVGFPASTQPTAEGYYYPKVAQRVTRQQKAKCPNCGQPLFNGEDIHIHHTIPRTREELTTAPI